MAIDFNSIYNSKIAKKYLKETNGVKCEICGSVEWMQKEIPLVLDHINGNSSPTCQDIPRPFRSV
jgi:hypothetical protein